ATAAPPAAVEANEARLGEAMLAALRRNAPAARLDPAAFTIRFHGPELPGEPPDSGPVQLDVPSYSGSATVRYRGGYGVLTIGVRAAKPGTGLLACSAPRPMPTCAGSTGPDGERIVTLTDGRAGSDPSGTFDIGIVIQRLNGVVVTVAHKGETGKAGAGEPTPPLSVKQLTDIGLDPRITV
ncbi:MAG TPA: hypothetical protein VES42_27310, partial [Pilimelia sp.]|nr:hypothetical protein [Pilimelia sp.]